MNGDEPSGGATRNDGTAGAPTLDGRAVVKDVLVVLAAFVVAALVAGALWPQFVDPVVVEVTKLGLLTDEVALGERFDTVGWYSLLGGGFGLLLGAVLTARGRAHEVATLLAVLAGAGLAAWLSARVGTWFGPGDAEQALAGAAPGSTAEEQIRLTTDAAYLTWPIAALVGSALVLWSRPGRRGPAGISDRET